MVHSFEIEGDPLIGQFHVGSRTQYKIGRMSASLFKPRNWQQWICRHPECSLKLQHVCVCVSFR